MSNSKPKVKDLSPDAKRALELKKKASAEPELIKYAVAPSEVVEQIKLGSTR